MFCLCVKVFLGDENSTYIHILPKYKSNFHSKYLWENLQTTESFLSYWRKTSIKTLPCEK